MNKPLSPPSARSSAHLQQGTHKSSRRTIQSVPIAWSRRRHTSTPAMAPRPSLFSCRTHECGNL